MDNDIVDTNFFFGDTWMFHPEFDVVNDNSETKEEIESENSDDGNSGSTTEEEDDSDIEERLLTEKMIVDNEEPYFKLGMTYKNANEARSAIATYAVANGRKLKLKPNEPGRIRAKCVTEEGCNFMIFLLKDGKNDGLAIKNLNYEHNCYKIFENPLASARYLANYFRPLICKNLELKVKDMKNIAEVELKIMVSLSKCKRAKRTVKQELDGSYIREFEYLEAYSIALKKSNPETSAEIELCPDGSKKGMRIFRRMYICFGACKQGWKSGCRPIIGLDGCFLKSVCRGQLLAAVGKDADDQIYPIAWAVIDKENKDNWLWFLSWLVKDLMLQDGTNITIISDMQKGLIDAVKTLLPNVEHQWCARHIWANWSKKWGGKQLQKHFWICSWSTYEEEFVDNLKKLGELNKKAAEDLVYYPPNNWCRAYFSNISKSDMVDNNITECFNAWIKDARYKPIISMLEDIRLLVMNRLAEKKASVGTWINEWSPTSIKVFQDNKWFTIGCKVVFNGEAGFEIGEGNDKHTVFIDRKVCTCRAWDLTGIPCSHAICALTHLRADPMVHISEYYHKERYVATYQYLMQPVPGKRFMDCDNYLKIEPPPVSKMPGRPRKKRIRSANEPNSTSCKLSRKNQTQTCSKCHGKGHNKSTCKNIAQSSESGSNNDVTQSSSSPSLVNETNLASVRPLHSQACKRKLTQEKRHLVNGPTASRGLGLLVHENSGHAIWNPGMSGEHEFNFSSVEGNCDPNIRFAIPNERVILREKFDLSRMINQQIRSINFHGDGPEVRYATNLPFKPRGGLHWQGAPAIFTKDL